MSTSTSQRRADTLRNAYMTDELQAIYDQTVDFVTRRSDRSVKRGNEQARSRGRSSPRWEASECSACGCPLNSEG